MRMAGPRRAVAAALALLAGCWIAQAAAPTATDFKPAPRSTLQTQREPGFVVARWQQGERTTTLLARPRPGREPEPVLQLVQQAQGVDARVSIDPLGDTAALDLATLEQAYVLLLRQEPLARYCLRGPVESLPACDAAGGGVSHAQALEALAALRERAAAAVPAAVPWRVVQMSGAPRPFGDPDLVAVRASGPQGPLEQVTLYFNRAPHSICAARTGTDGQAQCRLEDQHGDGDQHDHATAVVATFPGDVRPDRVLLPTTVVLASMPGRLLAPFARPPVWPPPSP